MCTGLCICMGVVCGKIFTHVRDVWRLVCFFLLFVGKFVYVCECVCYVYTYKGLCEVGRGSVCGWWNVDVCIVCTHQEGYLSVYGCLRTWLSTCVVRGNPEVSGVV